MTNATSHIEMPRKFGSDIGLPKLDVDQPIETHKKNIDAMGRSANVAAQDAKSAAQKQREVLEAGLREAATLAREYKPLDKVHENVAVQTEFASKLLEKAPARQSTAEAVKIIQDRVKDGLEEIRGSNGRNKPA